MALAAGTRLGPYEILSAIGAGGMGEVYRAKDTRLDRVVAVKVLPPVFAHDLRDRFEREARAVSSLNHPNICALYDVGEEHQIQYFVMEYLDGESLAERLLRGPLPVDQALRCASQIADALDKAHRQGIVHRDLKPGNVMLTKSGAGSTHSLQAKLLDFGLAKFAPARAGTAGVSALATSPAPLTTAGSVLGTFQYMAPEQLEGGEADARSDIFAFGAVLYEMVTGRKAFEGKSQASLIAAILEREPTSIVSLQPAAPPELDRIVRTCLAKDPDDRFQTAHDLLLQLKWIANSADSGAAQVSTPPAPRPVASRQRAAWIALPALALGAAVAGLTVWAAMRGPDTPPRPPTRFTIAAPASGPMYLSNFTSVAVSQDGRRIAFSVGVSPSRLYVRSIDRFDGTLLPGTEGAVSPFFSPDGQWIGFVANSRIKKVPVDGGTVVTVAEAPTLIGGFTWTADDRIVFGQTGGGLMAVPATGGSVTPLTTVGGKDDRHRWPHFVPTGNLILYTAAIGQRFRVAALSLDTGKTQDVTDSGQNPTYLDGGYLVYGVGDALLAAPFDARRLTVTGPPARIVEGVGGAAFSMWYAASPTGTLAYIGGTVSIPRRIVIVDRRGTEVQTLPAPLRMFEQPRLSPDGTRLALNTRETGAQNIWTLDLARGTMTRLTFGSDEEETPVWAPDSKTLFFKAGSGSSQIRSRASDGSGVEQPVKLAGAVKNDSNVHLGSVSPDGKLVAMNGVFGTTGEDIWIAALDGSSARPFVNTPFQELAPAFSPDGRFIAYSSDESGGSQIYVQPVSGPGGKWQVSTDGGTEPVWARSGKELFYRDEDRMMVAPVDTMPTFTPGTPRQLFASHYEIGHRDQRNYDVSADGQRFVMLKTDQSAVGPSINVIVDWTTEVAERVKRTK